MSTTTRFATNLVAIGFAVLAIGIASIAFAQDEQKPTSEPTKDQKSDQSTRPADLQLNPQTPATTDKEPGSTSEQTQQKTQQDQQLKKDEQPQSGDEKQPTKRDEKSRTDQTNRADRSPLRYNTPGAPLSWDSPRGQQSQQQGASLGVNITGGDRGVTVSRVHDGTPAQQMDLRPGDRITSVNGEQARSVEAFISQIRNMNPGDMIELSIVRGGNTLAINGNLEAYDQAAARNPEISGSDEFRNYQGVINRGPNSNEWSRDNVSRNEGTTERSLRNIPFSRDAQRNADTGETLQTSFEDRGDSNRAPSGDVETRLSRIEDQLDRISQDLEELRNTIGTGRLSDETATGRSDELRTRTSTARPRTDLQQNGRLIRQNDRWNTENRFEQADLPAARERAAQEAARRRAEQTGARLQQQQRAPNANSQQPQQPETSNPPAEQLPATQPSTDQPPSN